MQSQGQRTAMAQTPADAAKLRAKLLERKRLLNQEREQQRLRQRQQQEQEQVPPGARAHDSVAARRQADEAMQRKQRRSVGEGEVVQTARNLIVQEAARGLDQHVPGKTSRRNKPSEKREQPPSSKSTRRAVSPPPVPAAAASQQKASQQPKAPNALWQQSASFKAHSLSVMCAIDSAFGLLGDLEKLVPVLEGLGSRHVGYGAKPEHYDWVGSALVSTLHTAFGPEVMNAGMTQAYVTVYRVVKHTMLSGAGEDNLGPPPALPTEEQAAAVVKTWTVAKDQVGLQDVGQLFFKTLFSQHPQAMGLFSRFKHGEETPPDTSEEEDDYSPAPAGRAALPEPKALSMSASEPEPQVSSVALPEPKVSSVSASEPAPQLGLVHELRSQPGLSPEAEAIPDKKPESEMVPSSSFQGRSRGRTGNANGDSTPRSMRLSSFKNKDSLERAASNGPGGDGNSLSRRQPSSETSGSMTESTQLLLKNTTRVTMNRESEEAMALEIKRLAQMEANQRKWAWITSLRLMPTLTVIFGFIFIILQPDVVCWALYSGARSFWTPEMNIEEVCPGHSGLAVFLGAGGEVVPDELPIAAVESSESPHLSEGDIALLLEAVRNGNDAVNLLVATSLQSGGVVNSSTLALFTASSNSAAAGGSLVQQFDVNDAISNYLSVVGLIYALIFSQQYASAISRQREIEDSLATEAGGIQICMNLVRVLDDRSHYNSAKVKVLLLLSSYVEDLASHIAVMAGYEPILFSISSSFYSYLSPPPPPILLVASVAASAAAVTVAVVVAGVVLCFLRHCHSWCCWIRRTSC